MTVEISRVGERQHNAFDLAVDAPIDSAGLLVVARAVLHVTPTRV